LGIHFRVFGSYFTCLSPELVAAGNDCLDLLRIGHLPLFKGGALLLGYCIQRSNWLWFNTPTSFMKKKVSTVLSINHMPMTLKAFWIGARWARDIPAACLQATIVSIHVCQTRAAQRVIETFDAGKWKPACCPILEYGWVRGKVFTTERTLDVVVAHGDHHLIVRYRINAFAQNNIAVERGIAFSLIF
jgi:hypothetical protein